MMPWTFLVLQVLSSVSGAHLVGLAFPCKAASLCIQVIHGPEGVRAPLLCNPKHRVRSLRLDIVLQAWLQCEAVLLQAECDNTQLLVDVISASTEGVKSLIEVA